MRFGATIAANELGNLCCFDFECYEVHGRLTFEFGSHDEKAATTFWNQNEIMLLAFVKALGRRCYEFYRGSRSKKQLVDEMQKAAALESELGSMRYL